MNSKRGKTKTGRLTKSGTMCGGEEALGGERIFAENSGPSKWATGFKTKKLADS